MEDSEIIKQVLEGDQDAYAMLVRKYSGRILSLCHSMIGSKNAEDAAQEIFLKVYQSLNRFHGNSAFSTWLYRVAYNHCLDLIRKETRHRAESWEKLIEERGEEMHGLLTDKSNIQEHLKNSDLVHQVLSLLPTEYRLILTLRELNGFSYQEIAELTHSSFDSVKARLRRAREDFEQKLRHLLKRENV